MWRWATAGAGLTADVRPSAGSLPAPICRASAIESPANAVVAPATVAAPLGGRIGERRAPGSVVAMRSLILALVIVGSLALAPPPAGEDEVRRGAGRAAGARVTARGIAAAAGTAGRAAACS